MKEIENIQIISEGERLALRALNTGVVRAWEAGVASFAFVREGDKLLAVFGGERIEPEPGATFKAARKRLLAMCNRRHHWFWRGYSPIHIKAFGAEFILSPSQISADEITCTFYVKRGPTDSQQPPGAYREKAAPLHEGSG